MFSGTSPEDFNRQIRKRNRLKRFLSPIKGFGFCVLFSDHDFFCQISHQNQNRRSETKVSCFRQLDETFQKCPFLLSEIIIFTILSSSQAKKISNNRVVEHAEGHNSTTGSAAVEKKKKKKTFSDGCFSLRGAGEGQALTEWRWGGCHRVRGQRG